MNRALLEKHFEPAQIRQRKGRNGLLDYVEGHTVLARLNDALADFWNFKGVTKYDDLTANLPRADSVHAKAHYPEAGQMDREDFLRCMDLARAARFDGPYSLIFDGPGGEWDSLAEIQEVVATYVHES